MTWNYTATTQTLLEAVRDYPPDTLADRFYRVMESVLAAYAPVRADVVALFQAAMTPDGPANLPGQTTPDAMYTVITHMVSAAPDAPREPTASHVINLCYTFYWLLILFWLYDRTPQAQATHQLLHFCHEALKLLRPFLVMPLFANALNKLTEIVRLQFAANFEAPIPN